MRVSIGHLTGYHARLRYGRFDSLLGQMED